MMDMDPTYLALSLLFSGAGFVLFSFGKKTGKMPHLVAGLALMCCPYFITNIIAMAAVCIPIAVVPFFMPEA